MTKIKAPAAARLAARFASREEVATFVGNVLGAHDQAKLAPLEARVAELEARLTELAVKVGA